MPRDYDDEYYNEDEYDEEYEDYEDDYDDDYEDDDYDEEYEDSEYYDDDEYDEDEYDDDVEEPVYREPLLARLKERMGQKASVWMISALIVLVTCFSVYKFVDIKYFQPVNKRSKETVNIEIPRNTSVGGIAKILEENGIIRSTTVFKLYADFNDKASKMKAGYYELSPSMTINDVIDTLCLGESSDSVGKLQLVEGAKADDLLKVLKKDKLLRDEDKFTEAVKTGKGYEEYSFVAAVLDPDGQKKDDEPAPEESNKPSASPSPSPSSTSGGDEEEGSTTKTKSSYTRIAGERKYVLEGYLFPETYYVFENSTTEEILNKLLNQFDKIFGPVYQARAEELGMTVDDVITLASIIEKEAKEKGDFKRVSAAFHNRLKENGKLESCATAQYFLETNRLVIEPEEMERSNPYNTYKYAGLPAGPICNPGQRAIDAALYPDEEYLEAGYKFFCLEDPETGKLYFTKTYKEHQKAVKKYRPKWIEHDKKVAGEKTSTPSATN